MEDLVANVKKVTLSPSSSSDELPMETPPSKGNWMDFKPECGRCHVLDALFWRVTELGEIRCRTCPSSEEEEKDDEKESDCEMGAVGKQQGVTPTTSKAASDGGRGRSGPRKGKGGERAKGGGRKASGRGWRSLIKHEADSATVPPVTADVVTSEFMLYHGTYYEAGDVVSVTDVGGCTFYAQLRGFMQDRNGVKCTVITWLLPTQDSPKDRRFDPSTYILGPEEDIPRNMKFFELVMHLSPDYFKDRKQPLSCQQHQRVG